MEYLMTYSWAILILAVVLGSLFALGLFSPGGFVNTQCLLPAGLACSSLFLASNGLLSLNLLQATSQPINITALGCNSNNTISTPANVMQPPLNPPSNQVKLQIGSNYTFNVQCKAGSGNYVANPGGFFAGYLFVNYTELTTGFPHTAAGPITAKVT